MSDVRYGTTDELEQKFLEEIAINKMIQCDDGYVFIEDFDEETVSSVMDKFTEMGYVCEIDDIGCNVYISW